MNAHRLALWAAVAAVIIWALKAAAIGVAGGPGRSPLEDPLFFGGLLAFVIAVVALVTAATGGARRWTRVLSFVGVVVAGALLTFAVGAIVEVMGGQEGSAHWLWGEVNLWVSALVVLTASAVLIRVRPRWA
ncbi:hypothetical protein [Tessaracoccus sp. MC1756]|uniref:hypothetical protein n=1 Tax=Tessaracoccus sp. MC1756 TaxID=2760311 RepID=UPI0016015CD7|nr:hypothetical protein [Tessaracoccus sp. MC1756]MBB1508307.1 hypothetical protein [Tessaracoccus sp. MC1756]